MIATFLWMVGAILSFSLMAIAGRELSHQINTFELLFFRGLFGLIVITTIISLCDNFRHFQTQQIKGHFLRNLFHFLGQYTWFIGLGLLPLAQVFAIEFTVPFWTAIIAAIFLNECLTIRKVCAILIAFSGVLLIVQPPLDRFEGASLIVLGAAIFYACAHSGTKYLARHNHPLTILFYMCLIQTPIAGVLMLPNWTMPNAFEWSWISVVAMTALSAHFCMTKAMLTSAVTTVVTLDFLRLPLIALVGFFAYNEPFGMLSIIGSLVILIAMLINFQKATKK
ncbi:DMT family transporter [Psychromonas sp. KJ10-10]|uniref:DMT family transporter n=1 Tax=Psychromonas sp. KJ10-10 TaxID=3391823 RepID=UPI0039B67F4F